MAADESEPIFRLIYRSHSRIAPADDKTGLGEIFGTARRNNKRLDITGALMVSGDSFVQTLEGVEADVRGLYGSICEDSRHSDLTILEEQGVPVRTFGRWAMAKVSEDGGPDIRLLSNAKVGTIVSVTRKDESITEAQEAVLGFMRASLAQPVADE